MDSSPTCYPNDDPEDALIKLLDRARRQASRRAEQQVIELRPPEAMERIGEVVGDFQELCQKLHFIEQPVSLNWQRPPHPSFNCD